MLYPLVYLDRDAEQKVSQSYELKRASFSTYGGIKYLNVGDSCVVRTTPDIGDVSKEEVGGDSEAAALLSSRTVNGEVVAVEYLEVFAGCGKCKANTQKTRPDCLECQKCGAMMKPRFAQRKVAARTILQDEVDGEVSTVTLFEEHVDKLTESGAADGDDLKVKLLQAPPATFKKDGRNVVLSFDFLK